MTPRRILHLFPTFEAGGQQVRTCTLMNALGPGFSHSILAIDGRYDAASMLSPAVRSEMLEPLHGKGSLTFPLQFRKLVQRVQPDLILTYNWGSFDGIVGSWLAGCCPVIHTEDGFGRDEAERLHPRRTWARRLMLNRIAGLVVPSRTLLKIANRSFRIRPELVRWIPNGIDTERFQPRSNQELRHSWGLRAQDVAFGYAGRLGTEKNLGSAIRALAQTGLSQLRLVLIGDGPCRPSLEELAQELGVGDRVLFTGPVQDTAPMYNALDGFVLSSLTEQMPMSLLEAMASGLPAVCTDVGDCAHMLGTRELPAIVPRDNVAALTAALTELASNAGRRQALGEQNRRRVCENYSLEQMISAYRQIYETRADALRPQECTL